MELQQGKRYIVTKASECGTFRVGDRIRMESDGSIINRESGMWLDAEEVESIVGFEVEEDEDYTSAEIEQFQRELMLMEARPPGKEIL